MDCAGNSAGYSSVATQISYGHAALGDISTYDLRVLYGRPRAAAHPSLFWRTDRLIVSNREQCWRHAMYVTARRLP
jgi:hypothetical protein